MARQEVRRGMPPSSCQEGRGRREDPECQDQLELDRQESRPEEETEEEDRHHCRLSRDQSREAVVVG